MFKHKVLIGITVLVVILGILLFLSWVAVSEKKFTAYDPDSYSPEGLKAVNLLLTKSGYRVSIIHKLPAGRRNLMVVITTGLGAGQRRQILDWVNQGGALLELNAGPPDIRTSRRALGPLKTEKVRFAPHPQPDNFLADLNYHRSGTPVAVITDPEQGFYGTGRRFFIYRQSLGAGNLIVWNDLDGLTNRFLKLHPDNGVIFAALIRKFSPAAEIDFYNLAFKAEQSPVVRRPGQIFNRYWGGGLLLCLGVVLAIWKLAARFGRPRPLQLARGRSYEEFVYSLASLFRQAKQGEFVLDNLWRDLLKIMADLTHSPMDAAPEQLISAMERLTGKEYGPLRQLWAAFGNLSEKRDAGAGMPSSARLSSKQFLIIASQLDDYRKEFRAWKKSNPFAAG